VRAYSAGFFFLLERASNVLVHNRYFVIFLTFNLYHEF
jgi:hypothetical protein